MREVKRREKSGLSPRQKKLN